MEIEQMTTLTLKTHIRSQLSGIKRTQSGDRKDSIIILMARAWVHTELVVTVLYSLMVNSSSGM